jgi:trehalose-6-phosphatase
MIDIASISELKIKDYIIEDINKFLNQYYDRYTGVYIHSKKFLENNIDL